MSEPEAQPERSAAEIILLRADAFVYRHLALTPGMPAEAQVRLAVEAISPFPPEQVSFGYVLAPDETTALVYAAFKRNLRPTADALPPEARLVVPDTLALLGNPPANPLLRLWTTPEGLIGAAWNGRTPLPVAVVAGSQRESLLSRLRARIGASDIPVEHFTGAARATYGKKTGTRLFLEGAGPTPIFQLPEKAFIAADLRDKAQLQQRVAESRRAVIAWRTLVVCLILLGGGLLGQGGLSVAAWRLDRLRQTVADDAPRAARIEAAQTLSLRIEETKQRRLRPFELLALVNRDRPTAMIFSRVTTVGARSLEIEASSPQAGDASALETALRQRPELERIELRDLRTRDALTSFTLTAQFTEASVARLARP